MKNNDKKALYTYQNDPTLHALQNYTQQYTYNALGSIQRM